MRNILVIAAVLLVLLVGTVWAGSLAFEKNSQSYYTTTLASSVSTTAVTTGTGEFLKGEFPNHTCTIILSGASCTMAYAIETSIDNSSYFPIGTATLVSTQSPTRISITGVPSLYTRYKLTSATCNTTNTPSFTIKCLSSHN